MRTTIIVVKGAIVSRRVGTRAGNQSLPQGILLDFPDTIVDAAS